MVTFINQAPMYCLRYPDGRYVQLDQSSGGYPVGVNNWTTAQYWPSYDSAARYASHFTDGAFQAYKVDVNITAVYGGER